MIRRSLGAALLVATLLPVFRLLDPARAGPAGQATLAVAEGAFAVSIWGAALTLLAGVALAVIVPADGLGGALALVGSWTTRLGRRSFALLLGSVATTLGAVCATSVHRRLPRLVDEMAQLLHARVFESGRLALALPDPVAGRLIQNSLVTSEGWVSVYPPGHTLLLATGLRVGGAWFVGPLLLGVTATAAYLALDRLYPNRTGTTRLAGILVTLSPFLLFLGSGYLSHVSAMAAVAVALYLSLRARDGAALWGVAAGAAAAFSITSRPWTGTALGAFLTAGVLAQAWWRDGRSPRWLATRLACVVAGGVPFGVAFLHVNDRLFGGAFRLGYDVLFGPAHGLGLQVDPWGNVYGLREAIGYTSADLVSLGTHLLEIPFPLVGLVGVFLLVTPRLSPGSRILVGWALLPVAANALYWHHGFHLGPRMLLEAAPAWAALTAVALSALTADGADPGLGRRSRPDVLPGSGRALVLGASVGVVVAITVMVPSRLSSYAWSDDALVRSRPPAAPAPALVFVHGSWPGRIASRLAGSGMRRDSIETLVRRNDICRAHRYATARIAGEPVDSIGAELAPEPGSPAHLVEARVGGVAVRRDPSRPWTDACLREAGADRFGGLELAPLLWRTTLPGSVGGAVLYRDLGPETNARVRAAYPERTAYVYLVPGHEEPPTLVSYEEGMAALWSAGEISGPPGPG